MSKVIIKQIKSTIGRKKSDKRTLQSLGLNKINDTVTKDLNPQINGMINTVKHLVIIQKEL